MAGVQKALAFAQDAQNKKLGLTFSGKSVGNGEHVPRAEAQSAPQLSLEDPKGPYIAVEIDLDAPYKSFAILGPILHWVQPGLTGSGTSSANSSAELSVGGVPFVVDYAAPGPPPGAAPHRYLFLLYDQPADFDGKKFGQPAEGQRFPMTKRMRFDLDGFVKNAKLGDIVAANWFVSN